MRTAALLLLLTFATQTLSAPAPFRREAKPAPLAQIQPGRWSMSWCGGAWDVELWGDGTYRSRYGDGGDVWHGDWSFDPATRVLTVCEAAGSGGVFRWSVTLDAALSGRMAGGGVIALRRH